MRLPEPPLLLVTDRRQARWPLVEIGARAITVGCRWISVREKDLSEGEQITLVRTLLLIASRHGARVSLHGEAALAKVANADGVHLSARSNPIVARELLGADKLIGVSIHTVTEAEAIDPGVVDYAIAGPAFETASKPGYGPQIGRKGLAEIAAAARVPIIAIGGINVTRVAEVLAVGPAGIAVMGDVMRSADPQQEMKALLATVTDARR
ncbi:MAG: thiamine phosphate synthase [Xanthobacteraceae bacterium]